jgi:hypothetical protein
METHVHRLPDLFGQLGLANDPAAIERFIAENSPLPAGTALADAACWSPSQARFLREQVDDDADWAEVVDSLSVLVSA